MGVARVAVGGRVTAADGRPRSFGRVGDSARRRGAPDSGKRLLAYGCEVAVVRPGAEHAPMENITWTLGGTTYGRPMMERACREK